MQGLEDSNPGLVAGLRQTAKPSRLLQKCRACTKDSLQHVEGKQIGALKMQNRFQQRIFVPSWEQKNKLMTSNDHDSPPRVMVVQPSNPSDVEAQRWMVLGHWKQKAPVRCAGAVPGAAAAAQRVPRTLQDCPTPPGGEKMRFQLLTSSNI